MQSCMRSTEGRKHSVTVFGQFFLYIIFLFNFLFIAVKTMKERPPPVHPPSG
jgi:hypothetical protein